MKLSLFYELATPDGDNPDLESQAFDNALEQIALADELGFHGVWEVEHHFLPGYSHSSCPEVFLAAASQRTKRIRLGHGIVQLPFGVNNPIRVAERVATLDVLSKGRVEFGAGRGTIPMELEGFGVDPEQTREELVEGLSMLPKIWTESPFSWEGKRITVPPRTVVPRPYQKPHPPMWVAATQPWTIEFAAQNGLGLLGFGIGDSARDDLIKLYRREIQHAKPLGAFVNNRFAVMRVGLCLDTDEEALAIQGENFRLFYAQLEAVNSSWRFSEAPRTYEYASERAKKRLQAPPLTLSEVVAAGGAVIGSVETCRKALSDLAGAGVDEVILFMQGATTPHDKVVESIKNFARLIPEFE
jgi:alkanesulfonate monooxygenase SsuD/methylene tetrahydromethanopterin reductase-like flavin-dependent oxidoreductase (luciferase family)